MSTPDKKIRGGQVKIEQWKGQTKIEGSRDGCVSLRGVGLILCGAMFVPEKHGSCGCLILA